jgi:hypothetical protein
LGSARLWGVENAYEGSRVVDVGCRLFLDRLDDTSLSGSYDGVELVVDIADLGVKPALDRDQY